MSSIPLNLAKERITALEALQSQFSVEKQVQYFAGRGLLPMMAVQNHAATATIALHGGLLLDYAIQGDESAILWSSGFASLSENKAIRGGVPICWPWFGAHDSDAKKPAHGFARNYLWSVKSVRAISEDKTEIVLALPMNEATYQLWPHRAKLQLTITIGHPLEVTLTTHNVDDHPIEIGEAFHTYFAVSDIDKIAIHGLSQTEYLDKVNGGERKKQEGAITFQGEVDRVYLNTAQTCTIEDSFYKRRVHIEKRGSQSSVVWNPWDDKAARLGDMGYQDYRKMVCVEVANAVENKVTISPDQHHELGMSIRVEK